MLALLLEQLLAWYSEHAKACALACSTECALAYAWAWVLVAWQWEFWWVRSSVPELAWLLAHELVASWGVL
jgi:hypothetical protein